MGEVKLFSSSDLVGLKVPLERLIMLSCRDSPAKDVLDVTTIITRISNQHILEVLYLFDFTVY